MILVDTDIIIIQASTEAVFFTCKDKCPCLF